MAEQRLSDEKTFELMLREQARTSGTPLFGAFELTGRCNFDCKMCFVHIANTEENRKKELNYEQITAIMQDAIDAGMLFAVLSGGECLLRPDFFDLYSYLYDRGVKITVKTNGWLLSQKHIDFFKSHPPKEISITLYGSNEENYEAVTGQRAFTSVMKSILDVHEARLPLSVTITPTKYSIEDVPNIVSILKSHHITYSLVPYLIKPREGITRDDYYPTVEQQIELLVKLRKMSGKSFYPVPDPIPSTGGNRTEAQQGVNCSAGAYRFAITWDGFMTPCFSVPYPRIDMRSFGFADAWKQLLENDRKVLQPVECDGCAYSKVCIRCPAVRAVDMYSGHCNQEICTFMREKARHGLLDLNK